MTVMIVLEFDDEEFAKQWATEHLHRGPKEASLVGIYKKPDQYCTCAQQGIRTKGGFTRGQVYGWYVCSNCNKPSKAVVEHFGEMGINLLPQSMQKNITADRMGPEWKSKREWSFLRAESSTE